MADQNAVLEAAKAGPEKEPTPKKRGRGRPKKVDAEALRLQAEAEQRAKEKATAAAKLEAINRWADVSAVGLTALSKVVDTKFPNCGPTPQEIDAVKGSAGWLLDYYFPEENELSMHWSNVVMMLLVPTGMRVIQQQRQTKGAETRLHMNGSGDKPKAATKEK